MNQRQHRNQKMQESKSSSQQEQAQRSRSRHIPNAIRREIWSNWRQGCAFELENGKCCGSLHNLQTDHIQEFCAGGSHDRHNLRLVCGAHNRYRSDRKLEFYRKAYEQVDKIRAMAAQFDDHV